VTTNSTPLDQTMASVRLPGACAVHEQTLRQLCYRVAELFAALQQANERLMLAGGFIITRSVVEDESTGPFPICINHLVNKGVWIIDQLTYRCEHDDCERTYAYWKADTAEWSEIHTDASEFTSLDEAFAAAEQAVKA
jgi:hypothetical protein